MTPPIKECNGKKPNLLGAPLTPRKTKSRSSVRSVGSRGSLDSIGMAASSRATLPSRVTPLSTSHEYRLRFRLLPEGTGDNDFNVFERNIYDCMVFIIYCSHHDRIVLTNVNDKNRMYSWFPFVLVHEAFTYAKTIEDGVAIILGKADAEMDQTMALSLPKYEAHFMGMHRTQCPKTRKYHQRIAVLVHIKQSNDAHNDFRCCQDSAKIRWLAYNDLIGRTFPNELSWGDEVIHLARQLRAEERSFVTELVLQRSLANANADEASLLQAAKFTCTKVEELYTEYLHHLYPASLMTIHSFRCFMLKYPVLSQDDQRIDRIFFACACESRRYCYFRQLLLVIAAMEPAVATVRQRERIRCLFRFYDNGAKGIISHEVCAQLLTDIHRAANPSGQAPAPKDVFGEKPVTFDVFEAAVNANKVANIDLMLRSKRSYFEIKSEASSSIDFSLSDWTKWVGSTLGKSVAITNPSCTKVSKKPASRVKSNSKDKFKSKVKVSDSKTASIRYDSCAKHSALKKFEYAVHTVSIDTSSRCIDPRIITDNWINNWGPKELTLTRFSVEHSFRINAVHNIFLDLVRDFNCKLRAPINSQISANHENDTRGILCAKDDWAIMFYYFEMLCKQLLSILQAEPKLLRLNSPAMVIGDLLGGLADILAIEKWLYPTMPVVPGMLIFLGNYTGSAPSVELIIYIFSLKAQSPNKVHLLRGRNEMRQQNRKPLLRELNDKYGETFGEKMWLLINTLFDALPIAAILDEAILCAHSGIPNLAKGETLVGVFGTNYAARSFESVKQVDKQMPVAYELMANVPEKYAPTKNVKGGKKTNFTLSKSRKYSYFNAQAFIHFLRVNGLQYLLRSHNPSNEGFAHCYSCRCLTIFSNSLSSSLEFIAVALVNDHKVRVLRFKCSEFCHQGSSIDGSSAKHDSKIGAMETRISVVDSKTIGDL